jgi:hypothetical protein
LERRARWDFGIYLKIFGEGIAIFTCVVPILVAFDKLRQPLPELGW